MNKQLKSLQISHIELEHTNPTMGPYQRINTIRLSNTAETAGEINQFLNEAIVNNSIPLSEFIADYRSKDLDKLKKVFESFKTKKELNDGEQISNLTFYFFDTTKPLILNDVYRKHFMTDFYGKFTQYLVENGTITESGTSIESLKPINTDEDDEKTN
ncbi:hypothetical protein MM239_00670 [Belliella sp. DSM 111904]|uniref:Uncharacterized protein n=1 Tax=Belliella filtrata TaxID=2923435 RepID=A0ABS9UV30_9BACT|nr:hypothetical protein [Belliella filtrata]MCH7407893.1 hypothetical protein [Belliella filtrata]